MSSSNSLITKEQGMLAVFDHPSDLVEAIKQARKLKLKKLEAFTPFPLHEVHEALKLKRSWIPWGTLVCGLTGLFLTFLFQVWAMWIDGSGGRPIHLLGTTIERHSWYMNIGGKPLFSWPALVPVTFEGMVLIGGVSTVLILVLGYIVPNILKPVHDIRLTDDHFGLFIDQTDPNFNQDTLSKMLQALPVKEIKHV